MEVDLVSADGSFVTANAEGTRTRSPDGLKDTFTKNSDLFWAIRGGGGSTWWDISNIITANCALQKHPNFIVINVKNLVHVKANTVGYSNGDKEFGWSMLFSIQKPFEYQIARPFEYWTNRHHLVFLITDWVFKWLV